MRKFLSLVLTIVLFASLTVPVFATVNDESVERMLTSHDKAIIIIPGLGATSLEVTSGTYNGRRAWYNDDNLCLAKCRDDGTSVYSISHVDAASEYGIYDMYEDLYNELDRVFGNTYDIVFFPYDWRMSNTTSATALQTMINNRGYQEVILVAHSMGGLVASSYLCNSANRAKVDKLITLGTPYLGSPAILHAMETGEFFPDTFDYNEVAFKELIMNFSSAYQTLPPSRYFQDYVIHGNTTLVTFSATKNFLESRSWAKAGGSVKPMLAAAATYHNNLMVNSEYVTNMSTVEVYRLYGLGKETIDRVEYDSNGNYLGAIKNTLGDGTVSYLSATNFLSTKPRKSFTVDHNGLAKDPTVITFIIQCINGTATFSADNEIEANDRGWLIGPDNRRITVVVDGPNSFLDLLNSTIIYTSTGEQVIRDKNKLYVEQNDGTMKEIGTIWQAGSEAVEFSMHSGDYSFTFTTEPDSIVVEYSDSGYYERVLEYNLPDASAARLTVSNYDSKDVHCVQTVSSNAVAYSFETIYAYELPEDQLYDYKNPNK